MCQYYLCKLYYLGMHVVQLMENVLFTVLQIGKNIGLG